MAINYGSPYLYPPMNQTISSPQIQYHLPPVTTIPTNLKQEALKMIWSCMTPDGTLTKCQNYRGEESLHFNMEPISVPMNIESSGMIEVRPYNK